MIVQLVWGQLQHRLLHRLFQHQGHQRQDQHQVRVLLLEAPLAVTLHVRELEQKHLTLIVHLYAWQQYITEQIFLVLILVMQDI